MRLRLPSGRPCMATSLSPERSMTRAGRTTVGSAARPSSPVRSLTQPLPAPQVGDRLQRLVGGLDRLAVQLKGPLGLDQRDQFLHRVDVAGFEITLERLARPLL